MLVTQKPKLTRPGPVRHCGAAAAADSPEAQLHTWGGGGGLHWPRNPHAAWRRVSVCFEEGSFLSPWSVWRKRSTRSTSSAPRCKEQLLFLPSRPATVRAGERRRPPRGWPCEAVGRQPPPAPCSARGSRLLLLPLSLPILNLPVGESRHVSGPSASVWPCFAPGC